MTQLTLDAALDGVEANNLTWLEWARAMAVTYSNEWGSVTSDDIRRIADKTGYQPDSPKSWGALFKCDGWRCIGRERSRYASNNGRFICEWIYDN